MKKSKFSYKKTEKDGNLILHFDGEFDKLALSEHKFEINDIINKIDGRSLILDFEKLNYINSEAIGYLIQISDYLSSVDKKIVLVGVRENVLDVLKAIGIEEVIPIFDSLKNYLKG